MAYVARGPQGKRQDEGEAGAGGSSYSGAQLPTGGVQGTAKQSSVAKTPLQSQIQANKGRSQQAAVNSIYSPIQQGNQRTQEALVTGSNKFVSDAAQKSQENYGVSDDEIGSQLDAGSLGSRLSQAVGGPRAGVGKLDMTVPLFQASTEIMKGGAAPSLQRSAKGKYSAGMANLDSALLRQSGELGQLGARVSADRSALQGLERALEDASTADADFTDQSAYDSVRERTGGQASQRINNLHTTAENRYAAELARLKTSGESARARGKSQLDQAIAQLEAQYGNRGELAGLRGIDINQFVRDVQGPGQATDVLDGSETERYGFLADVLKNAGGGESNVPTGGYTFGQEAGFDDEGLRALLAGKGTEIGDTVGREKEAATAAENARIAAEEKAALERLLASQGNRVPERNPDPGAAEEDRRRDREDLRNRPLDAPPEGRQGQPLPGEPDFIYPGGSNYVPGDRPVGRSPDGVPVGGGRGPLSGAGIFFPSGGERAPDTGPRTDNPGPVVNAVKGAADFVGDLVRTPFDKKSQTRTTNNLKKLKFWK